VARPGRARARGAASGVARTTARPAVNEEPRASHLIRRRDVARWLAGSAVDRETFHVTGSDEARRLRAEGVRVERSAVDTSWGRGFYSSTVPDWQYGTVAVAVAVRLLRPLVIEDALEGATQIDAWLAAAGTVDVRQVVESIGHDGAVIHFGPGDLWVVAYRDEQVKVVRDA